MFVDRHLGKYGTGSKASCEVPFIITSRSKAAWRLTLQNGTVYYHYGTDGAVSAHPIECNGTPISVYPGSALTDREMIFFRYELSFDGNHSAARNVRFRYNYYDTYGDIVAFHTHIYLNDPYPSGTTYFRCNNYDDNKVYGCAVFSSGDAYFVFFDPETQNLDLTYIDNFVDVVDCASLWYRSGDDVFARALILISNGYVYKVDTGSSTPIQLMSTTASHIAHHYCYFNGYTYDPISLGDLAYADTSIQRMVWLNSGQSSFVNGLPELYSMYFYGYTGSGWSYMDGISIRYSISTNTLYGYGVGGFEFRAPLGGYSWYEYPCIEYAVPYTDYNNAIELICPNPYLATFFTFVDDYWDAVIPDGGSGYQPKYLYYHDVYIPLETRYLIGPYCFSDEPQYNILYTEAPCMS